jgi:hypothetical protein
MADILISQLPAGTPLLTDLLILANPTTGIAKKSTVTQLNSVLTLAKLSDVAQGTPPANSILEYDGGSFSYVTNVVRAAGLNVNRIPFLESTGPLTLSSSQIYQGANGVEITEFSPANISSVLFGLFSDDKGFLKPRMVSQNRIDLPNPVKGLEVFDTTLNIPYFYNGTAWKGVQEVLVSATNIKTINGTTILGSGDLTVGGGITTLNTLTASTQTFAVGSSGTDFTISSATSTHTFNLPTASASARGLLSSANWTTFNSKVGGSGTTNYLSKFTASGTIGNSLIFDNGTSVGVGTTSIPSIYKFSVNGTLHILGDQVQQSDGGGITFYNTAGDVSTGAISFNKYVGTYIYNSLNLPLKFGVNNAEAMRIDGDNNVLINRTTSSGFKFEVGGSIGIYGNMTSTGSIYSGKDVVTNNGGQAIINSAANPSIKIVTTNIGTGGHTTSGNHLPIIVNNVTYWLALLNPNP